MTEKHTETRLRIPEFDEWIENHGFAYRPWTPQEEEILIEYYGKIPTRLLVKKLNNRTIKSANEKARRMGITASRYE